MALVAIISNPLLLEGVEGLVRFWTEGFEFWTVRIKFVHNILEGLKSEKKSLKIKNKGAI